ncbi:E3 ubiquitin-protein ligase RNF165 isoform X1 [Scleropages formosus]|uniref:E3 ubiquitin-protein ligase RNF165 isoform X1 n=1 Tax=Scleropages formosus TaxID=113540 RepID=UPI0010FAC48C|nr:E3 ubiquitin-protein ligase RNF165 isoform X1 [Scleropages formosus]
MVLVHVGYLVLPVFGSVRNRGAHFNRHQHSHATSCRHFHLGPQAQMPTDFPVPHPGQSQPGMTPHLPPAHQHATQLHQPLAPLPAPQFQDVPGPPFLPQALHQQYLIQQQLLEAQHRRILPHSRRTQERVPIHPHRLRSGYDYAPSLHVPQPMAQQPRYLAEGTDWDLSVDAGLSHHQYQVQQLPQHYQHYLASPRMHHFPRNNSSAQVVVHEIRNYPYPQLHLLALQGLNPSRHASAVRESYEELLQLEDRLGSVNRGAVQTTIERFTFPHKYKKEITLHAPLPSGVCGPVAGHQQEVPHLSGGHRDPADARQLMFHLLLPAPATVPTEGLVPPRLSLPLPLPLRTPVLGRFAKCFRSSPLLTLPSEPAADLCKGKKERRRKSTLITSKKKGKIGKKEC